MTQNAFYFMSHLLYGCMEYILSSLGFLATETSLSAYSYA